MFDVPRQRPEPLFLGVDRHELRSSIFQREPPVFSAGNDPDPADVCPTGRGGGVRTQVCHLISAVKSIKSTHQVPPFSCFFSFFGDVL